MNYQLMGDMLEIDFGHDGINRLAGFMASYASKDGSGVWPSVGTLAQRMGRTERTVQRHLKALRDAGVIFEVAGKAATVCYRFNLSVVRLLVNRIIAFGELVAGKLSVSVEDETQMVLPGLEGQGCFHEVLPTELSPPADRDFTQSKYSKTIPAALRDDEDLKDKLLQAAGEAVDPDQAHGLKDLSEVRGWIENGADVDLDILPMVAARSAGKDKGSVYSWVYYRKAVLSAVARRTAVIDLDDYRQQRSVGKTAGAGCLQAVGSVVDRNYQAAIKLYEETGYWDEQFGDQPDLSAERQAS